MPHKWKKCEWERNKWMTSVIGVKHKWLWSVSQIPAKGECRPKSHFYQLIFSHFHLCELLKIHYNTFTASISLLQDTTHLNSYSLTGPSTLQLGTTGVWSLSAALHDLYSEVTLDVLAPIHQPGSLKIESININSVGMSTYTPRCFLKAAEKK